MIAQIIGWFCLMLFVIQFCLGWAHPDYKELRKTLYIDNTLLLIAAAICFK